MPRESELPANSAAAAKFRSARRTKLSALLHRPAYAVQESAPEGPETLGDVKAVVWKLKVGTDWTVPAVELSREGAKEGAIVVADEGRAAAAEKIMKLLDEGKRVLAVDPFYFGESSLGTRAYLFGLLVSAVGERPLGIQSGQLSAICRWWIEQHKLRNASIVAVGPRSSLIALVTAALDEVAISGVELNGSLGSLKEIIEQNRSVESAPEQFTFGLLELIDIRQLAAMVAPRPAVFVAPSDRAKQELDGLKAVYKAHGKVFDPVP